LGGDTRTTQPRHRRGGTLKTALGITLICAGIPLLVLPGPGLLLIGSGAALLGWNRARAGAREHNEEEARHLWAADPRRTTEEGPRQ